VGEIVNLRRARKVKKRAADDRTAEANRIAFGRSKAERALTDAEKALAAKKLDAHLLRKDDEQS
jgi:hypothetical protein